MNRGLEFCALDITHKCNLNCSFCGKMVWDSDYEITMKQVDDFCVFCNDMPISFIRVSGGEPLTHPHIDEILDMILTRMNRPIELATNGVLLHQHESIIPKMKKIHITPYPGVNDDAVDCYGDLLNVNLVTVNRWFDPWFDPDLTVAEGQKLYDSCCHAQANISDDKVYGCCMAETIERVLNLAPVHVELGKGWIKDYKALDCVSACQHCSMRKS